MIIKFNLYFTMMPLWPFVSLALSDIRAIYSWLISSVLPRMHVNTFSRSQSQKILFGINNRYEKHITHEQNMKTLLVVSYSLVNSLYT